MLLAKKSCARIFSLAYVNFMKQGFAYGMRPQTSKKTSWEEAEEALLLGFSPYPYPTFPGKSSILDTENLDVSLSSRLH